MYATSGDRQLAYLLPGVQTAERKLRGYAASRGITYVIADYGGARTASIVAKLLEWRDQAVAAGEPWYRVSPFRSTKHARGGAFDIRILTRPAGMQLDEAYRVLGAQAPQYGLIWGGTFQITAIQKDVDIYHFESQQSLAQLEARWADWINDPAFPPDGYIDPVLLGVLAALAVVIYFLFFRR